MEENKSWWQSKTVWGGIIAFAAGIAGVFGIAVPEAVQGDIAEHVTALASALGGLIAVYGRIKAERKVGK